MTRAHVFITLSLFVVTACGSPGGGPITGGTGGGSTAGGSGGGSTAGGSGGGSATAGGAGGGATAGGQGGGAVGPAPNDSCATATALTFNANGVATASGRHHARDERQRDVRRIAFVVDGIGVYHSGMFHLEVK